MSHIPKHPGSEDKGDSASEPPHEKVNGKKNGNGDSGSGPGIEQKILDNEARLRSIFENVEGSICLLDANKHLVTCNQNWAENYKWLAGKDALEGVDVYDFLPAAEKKRRDSILDRVLNGEKVVYEVTYVINDKTRYFRTSQNPIWAQGKVTGVSCYSIDITESRQAEELLKKEKIISDSVINSMPGVFYLQDENGNYLRWNKNFETILGYSAEEINGLHPPDSFEGLDKERVMEAIQKVFEEGSAEVEAIAVTKHGKRIPFYLNGQLIIFEGKRCLIGMGLDMSDRNRALEALARSEEKYRSLIEQASDAIMVTDFTGHFTDVNAALCNMFGYTKEELMYMNITQLIDPEQLKVQPISFDRLRAGDHVFSQRFMKHKDGTIIEVDANVKKFSENRILAIARDVTEIRKVQRAVEESEARFRGAFEFSAIGMALVSLEGKWTKVNKELCHIVGYTEEEFLNLTFQDITHPDDLEKDLAYVQQCLRGEIETYRMEKRYFHKSGALVWINLNVSMVKDSQGNPLYFVSQIEDITQRKKADDEIKALNESLEKRVAERTLELQEANHDLEAFNYSVSHDLQAPLRGISSFVDLLMNRYAGQLDKEGNDFLQIVRGNAVRMSQLIRDMLAFAKLGKAPFSVQTVDMEQMVQQVINDIRLDEPELKTEIKILPLEPANADPNLVRQVWVNLLSNAVKYSAKKEHPVVEVGMQQQDGIDVYYVKDNGAGFDMKHADKLFRPFKRLHITEEFEGSGVGLAAVDRIISKHGGKIWFDAKPNEGATFYFTLSS